MKASLILRMLGAIVASVLCLLHSASALASPAYPLVIKAELSLTEPPGCTLCHRDDVGGAGTVSRPFGRTLISRYGLVGGSNLGAMRAALAGDDADHADSDGDGAPDIDELRIDMNPNEGSTGSEASPSVPLPETGCTFSPRPASGAGYLLLALTSLALVRRNRRAFALSLVVATVGCSLDTRELRATFESGGDAGSSLEPMGGGGATVQSEAGAPDVGDAGSAAGGRPSGTAGSAPTVIDGCADVDRNEVPDCQETLVTNADFKLDVKGWAPQLEAKLEWDEENAAGARPSGSARISASGAVQADGVTMREASQCLKVSGKQLLTVYANTFVESGQDEQGYAEVNVSFFDGEDCSGDSSNGFVTPQPLDAEVGAWLALKAGALTRETTRSVAVRLSIAKPFRAASFHARFDNILVKTQNP